MLTVAQQAITKRDKERLTAEIQSSSDPDQPDKDGRTLLMWAVIEGDEDLVRLLVKSGSSINNQEKNSVTRHYILQRKSSYLK